MEYKCDWCGRPKKAGQIWILGLAGERKGVTGNRRQVEVLNKWNAEWAAHPLAVHFCSEKHKEKYLDALFNAPWNSESKGAAKRAISRRQKAELGNEKMSEAVVERHIAESPVAATQAAGTKKPRRRSKTKKLPAKLFAETDRFYARSLGIILEDTAEAKNPASEE